MQKLEHITHFNAQKMEKKGAILIDIREAGENAREYIEGSIHWALSEMPNNPPKVDADKEVIFFCRSGNRTIVNAEKINAAFPNKSYVLEGGITAWRNGELPTIVNKKAPLEMQRQVFLAAGLLMLIGTLLAATGNVWGLALTGFVGAGLTFSGITGFCGMAKVLMLMPWNKPVSA